MKNVLVTGETGFIASHLLPVLHKKNWNITTTVRKDFPDSPLVPLKRVTIGEIDGSTDWKAALENIDAVIHLAGRAHILNEKVADPEAEFLKVNTQGTANLASQAVAAGVKHFIFISSIGAMATLSQKTLSETSLPQPDSPYGKSKLKAEQALIEIAKSSPMSWTILRPPLVYGRGNPGNMANLVKLVKIGLPLPLGSVQNRRSFVYVENFVDAITVILTHPNAKNQTFLISDGKDLSTVELIQKIAYHLKQPVPIFPVPTQLLTIGGSLGDKLGLLVKRSLPLNSTVVERLLGSLTVDSQYIRKTLSWEPPYTVDRGLVLTLL